MQGMDEFRASFEIESKSDAYAVERDLNRMYDSLREEARTLRKGTEDSTEMLEEFEAVRNAARSRSPGTLTVVYESREDAFEE